MTDLHSKSRLPRSAWVVCGLLFLMPLGVWGLGQVRLSSNVHDWVQPSHPQAATYRWFQEHFPGHDPVVLSWNGSSLDDPRVPRFLDQVLGPGDENGKRVGGWPEVSRIRTPQEAAQQIAASAGISREESLRRLQGVLVGPGALRVRLRAEARPHQDSLVETLRLQAGTFLKFPVEIQAAVPAPLVDEEVSPRAPRDDDSEEDSPSPPDAEPGPAHQTVSPDEWSTWAPHDFTVRWQGMRPKSAELEQFERLLGELRIPETKGEAAVEASFFLPGSPVGLAIELTEAGRANRGRTIDLLKAAAVEAGVSLEDLHVAGDDVLAAAIDDAIPRVAWNPSVPWHWPQRSLLALCALGGAILACSLLRSVRLGLFVLAIAYGTTLLATALIPIMGSWAAWQTLTSSDGQFHLLLLLLPPLLLVLTLAMAIDIASEWQLAASRNPLTASAETLKVSLRPSLWTAGTIAAGLAAMFISPLPAIREFALHAALGVFLALGMTLVGLPALLRMFPPRRPSPEDLDAGGWETLGRGTVRLRWLIVTACVAAGFGGRYGISSWKAETKAIRSLAATTPVAIDHTWIEREMGGTVPVEIVVRFDPDAQDELPFLRRAEKVREIGSSLRELPDISGTLSLADFLPTVSDPGSTAPLARRRAFLNKSRQAEERLSSLAFAREYRTIAGTATPFNAPNDELWRVTAHLFMTAETSYGDALPRIDRACCEALRTVSGGSGESYRSPKVEVLYHPGASHHVTGAVPLTLAAQEGLLSSLTTSLILACILMGLAVMIQLRSVPAGALALAPNVVSVLGVFGILSRLGIPIGPGTAVTATIALGIGVDGTIHLLTWFHKAMAEGKNRRDAAVAAVGHCAPAIWQTGLVLATGLAVLVPCDLIPISRFGLFMTSLIGGSLVANLVVIPASLAGPLGWLLQPPAPKPVPPVDVESASEDTEAFRAPIRIDDKRPGHGPHAPASTPPRVKRP